MPVLKMQGRPITNFCLFRELLSPARCCGSGSLRRTLRWGT